MEPEEIDGLPKIPAQPIGYDDARELLEKMGGLDSPNSWKGKIKGIDYKVIYSNWISCHNLKRKEFIHIAYFKNLFHFRYRSVARCWKPTKAGQ